MNEEEIKEIVKVIREYKNKKSELINQRNLIEQKLRNGEISTWTKDLLIDNIYRDFDETAERKQFQELAKKANEDETFEKYFRATHLSEFYNIKIDPKTL